MKAVGSEAQAVMQENRAVSSLFRVFGGEEVSPAADRRVATAEVGMHHREMLALALLIPATVLVAVGDVMVRWIGLPVGMIVAVPAAFLTLHIVPFLVPVRTAKSQWHLWFSLCFLWGLFHIERGGMMGLISYIWMAVAVMSAVAVGVLGWRKGMALSGKSGVRVRWGILVGMHAVAVVLGFLGGWQFAVLVGFFSAAACGWAILHPSSQILGPVYTTTDFDGIFITIDDGPDPHDTPRLLELLDSDGRKALFFMIGEKVLKHPELAREVIRRGHEIGNHTQTHPQASFWCASAARTRREIEQCQQTIYGITGVKPQWFRAPVGHRNLFTHPIAAENGLRVMGWQRRGYDAVERDVEKVLGRILPKMVNGDIILVHEATPIAVEVLDGVLKSQRVKSSEV